MNEMFQLEGTTLRIILPQELDHPMADLIRKGTEMIAGRTYIRTIVFDFSETEFMDSSGIGLLMGRYRALGMRKDCIQAVGVNRISGRDPRRLGTGHRRGKNYLS